MASKHKLSQTASIVALISMITRERGDNILPIGFICLAHLDNGLRSSGVANKRMSDWLGHNLRQTGTFLRPLAPGWGGNGVSKRTLVLFGHMIFYVILSIGW